MLKHGIVTLDGLARPRTRLGARRYASLLLLPELAAADGSAEDYATVIRMVRMANGTWRDTFDGRLTPFDERVAEIVAERRWPTGPLRVADVGASSGATSVELYEALRRRLPVDFVASDRWRDVFAVQHDRGPTVILDADGNAIQYVWGRFVLPGQGDERWFYVVNRRLRRRAEARWLGPSRRAIVGRDLGGLNERGSTRLAGAEIVRVSLLSPGCRRCIRERPDFRFEVADVLRPLPWQAQVLRAMNVLTPFHFRANELRRAVANCLDAVVDGGLFVLGRSPSDRPQDLLATIYAKEGGALHVLARANAGCEIEDLVSEVSRVGAPRARRAAGG